MNEVEKEERDREIGAFLAKVVSQRRRVAGMTDVASSKMVEQQILRAMEDKLTNMLKSKNDKDTH